jgi:hypothetical protein
MTRIILACATRRLRKAQMIVFAAYLERSAEMNAFQEENLLKCIHSCIALTTRWPARRQIWFSNEHISARRVGGLCK